MRKTERRVIQRRIKEITFIDKDTLEKFTYPLDDNGCHILKMTRAKRTNYNLNKKKADTTETSSTVDTTLTEESSSPLLNDNEINHPKYEINLLENFQLPQLTNDNPPIDLQFETEITPTFNESFIRNIIDNDFIFTKFEPLDFCKQNDFNLLKLF